MGFTLFLGCFVFQILDGFSIFSLFVFGKKWITYGALESFSFLLDFSSYRDSLMYVWLIEDAFSFRIESKFNLKNPLYNVLVILSNFNVNFWLTKSNIYHEITSIICVLCSPVFKE